MSAPLIRLENVEKIYTSKGVATPALRGVSFTVEEGEFLAIAGPSGSGKTTLLNIVGCLDEPTSGRVFLNGTDTSLLQGKKRARFRLENLGFIFQTYNLIEVLTALENVEFPLLLRRVDEKTRRRKAREMLERVGLGAHLNKRPNQLSGGEQQRVAVARALITEPRIVLADEPTANLDSDTGRRLIQLMAELNQEKNVTFVFSTHDPMVMEEARRLIRLRDGRVVEDARR